MRKPTSDKILLFFAVVTMAAALCIFSIILYSVAEPDSPFNRRLIANLQKMIGEIKPLDGIRGEDGKDGSDGLDGKNGRDGRDGTNGQAGSPGQNGLNGQNATPEQIAAAVSQYLIENPPQKGDTGQTGQPGPVADFRCSLEELVLQYRYPGNEDWISTNAGCTPIGGSSEEVSARSN